jgi:hypothetical protein
VFNPTTSNQFSLQKFMRTQIIEILKNIHHYADKFPPIVDEQNGYKVYYCSLK